MRFYLFQEVQDSLQLFSLGLMRTFLPQTELSRHEGVIDDVKDVAVVVLEEQKGLLGANVIKTVLSSLLTLKQNKLTLVAYKLFLAGLLFASMIGSLFESFFELNLLVSAEFRTISSPCEQKSFACTNIAVTYPIL
jgi:hypothetical protein